MQTEETTGRVSHLDGYQWPAPSSLKEACSIPNMLSGRSSLVLSDQVGRPLNVLGGVVMSTSKDK